MAMAGVKPANDSEAADQATAKDEEPKKKAKEPAAPLTPEEERLAAAAQVAREFANSKREIRYQGDVTLWRASPTCLLRLLRA